MKQVERCTNQMYKTNENKIKTHKPSEIHVCYSVTTGTPNQSLWALEKKLPITNLRLNVKWSLEK